MLYRGTKIVISGVLLAGVFALTFGALSQPASNTPTPTMFQGVNIPTGADGILDQCGDVFVFDAEPAWYGTIPADYTGKVPHHPMLVPAYGYMSPEPFNETLLGTGTRTENPYTFEEIARGMWEGNHVIWVAPEFAEDGYVYLQDYASIWNEEHEDKIILLAWNFEYDMPAGRQVAFSDWNHTQTCQTFSDATYKDFQELVNADADGRDFTNPPAATLVDGKLPLIQPDRGQY